MPDDIKSTQADQSKPQPAVPGKEAAPPDGWASLADLDPSAAHPPAAKATPEKAGSSPAAPDKPLADIDAFLGKKPETSPPQAVSAVPGGTPPAAAAEADKELNLLADFLPEEKVMRDEIENLGKILEESLQLQKEISHERAEHDEQIHQAEVVEQKKQQIVFFYLRWIFAAAGVAGFFARYNIMAFAIVGLIALFNLLNLYYVRTPKGYVMSFPVVLAFDLVTITALVHYTGEARSLLFFLYYGLLGAVTAVYPLKDALIAVGAFVFLYGAYLLGGDNADINAGGLVVFRGLLGLIIVGWVWACLYLYGYYREHIDASLRKLIELVRQSGVFGEVKPPAAEAAAPAAPPTAGPVSELQEELKREREKAQKQQEEIDKLKSQIKPGA